MPAVAPSAAITIRALTAEDLPAVVEIDAALEKRSRRAYFQRRLAAALREPTRHVQLAAVDGTGLAGYVLARVLTGEFGRKRTALRLEVVGVRRDLKGHGTGRALLEALTQYAQRHDHAEIHTTAAWQDHEMLAWFDAMGFSLAPALIVDSPIDGGAFRAGRDEVPYETIEDVPREVDYGGRAPNDFEALARDSADVRAMAIGDLSEIARIDRAVTGRDRSAYIEAQFSEAMDDSAIRVSLTARREGAIVGFLMARADLGDFGRTEPTAVIDTIGVDPRFVRRGIGRALMSQLFANLGALRVERVESMLEPQDLPLTGLLYRSGFLPSQRLAFVRRVQ